ncbi:hypothetical protein FACS1894201_02260 [Bacteroidia bacterium]|nr:hypothetical protein FACS1894201_02260 [Bacteroidia bacterium]
MFSNKYILLYTSLIIVLIATVLSLAATLLQPFQNRNIRIEKMQNLLAAAGVETTTDNAQELYDKLIVKELLVNSEGKIIQDERKPFEIDIKTQLAIEKEYQEGRGHEPAVFPVFIANNKGEQYMIVPVYGKGLWGPLWGYIAFEADYNTVKGVIFGHKSETPGLGANITSAEFQNQFKGKKIFNRTNQFVSIAVVHGGAASMPNHLDHGVDAISGGTITSKGVAAMLQRCLGNYKTYFLEHQQPLLDLDTIVVTDTTVIDTISEEEPSLTQEEAAIPQSEPTIKKTTSTPVPAQKPAYIRVVRPVDTIASRTVVSPTTDRSNALRLPVTAPDLAPKLGTTPEKPQNKPETVTPSTTTPVNPQNKPDTITPSVTPEPNNTVE